MVGQAWRSYSHSSLKVGPSYLRTRVTACTPRTTRSTYGNMLCVLKTGSHREVNAVSIDAMIRSAHVGSKLELPNLPTLSMVSRASSSLLAR